MSGTHLQFPKSARLCARAEFELVKTQGRSWRSRCLVLGVYRRDEDDAPPRAGIITTRRLGGAVVRNAIRRKLREIIRLHYPRIKPGTMMVLIPRQPAASVDYQTLKSEWLHLASKASILTSPL